MLMKVPADEASLPTNVAEYRQYLVTKLAGFTPATAEGPKAVAHWYYSQAEANLRATCGIAPYPHDAEFVRMAKTRRDELLWAIQGPDLIRKQLEPDSDH